MSTIHITDRTLWVTSALAATVALVLFLALSGAGTHRSTPESGRPERPAGIPATPPTLASAPRRARPAPPPADAARPARVVRLRVVHGATGQPLEGASVHAVDRSGPGSPTIGPVARSDRAGTVGLTVATDSVLVAATGFAPRVVSTGSGDAEETPLHDVALPPLARLGGVVVDSVGRPVPHAIVAFVPRSTSFSGWNVALDGYEGAFSDDLSSVGYRVESDGAGAFSVPVPENDATLRIASADGVWISPSADESAGRVQPRDRTYMLWDVVELRARFVDTESRQPVDVDSWSAELLPDGARVDGQDLVDPPADLPSGEARFVGALEPPATQAVLRVAAVAWGYAPLAPVDVVLRPRRESGAVERTFEWVRIPAADWGRIHVEAEPGTTGDPRVSCVLRAAGSPPGVNEKLVHIGFDGSSGVDVDVPSGEYRLVPVAAHSKDSFVAHEGRLEAVVREFAPMSISVRRGARVRYVLRFGSEARLDIRWGARGPRRPAWLYVGPPQRVDPPGQRWPLVDFSPAPDRISVFVRDGYRGPIEVIGASGASHRIDVALGVGEVQSVDLGTR